MRTIIAGSRTLIDGALVEQGVKECGWQITAVVSGMARGIDRLGAAWARRNNIPVVEFPAQWVQWGKRAGYIRNALMAENAEALLLIWDGESKGSAAMLALARDKGLRIHIVIPPKDTPRQPSITYTWYSKGSQRRRKVDM